MVFRAAGKISPEKKLMKNSRGEAKYPLFLPFLSHLFYLKQYVTLGEALQAKYRV
jgi:hypothetical protein